MNRVICRSVVPCVRVVAALLIMSPLPANGQSPLTVEEAIRSALAHNRSLGAVHAAGDEAAARADEARSGFFPRLSVAETWQRGDQPVFVFSSLLSARRFAATNFAIDSLNHPQPIGFFRTSIGIDQLLFDGGRQRSASAIARLRSDIALASLDEASAGLVVTTTETFGRIVIADAHRRTADAGKVAAREDLARAERRRDAGMATEADVLALVVHVADLEQRALQADGDAAAARAELNRLIGQPIEADVRVVEPVMPQRDLGDRANVTALLAEAVAARPELRRAMATRQAAEAAAHQARAALIPQVAAQAAFDMSGTRLSDRASSWVVGGELRWTFSTGGAELAGMRATAAGLARAEAEADDARAAVQVEVLSALRRLEAAQAREAAGRRAVEQARESQRIIRDRFDAGIAPVNDVLRSSTAMLDADASRVQAVVDSMIAAAALRRALGRRP